MVFSELFQHVDTVIDIALCNQQKIDDLKKIGQLLYWNGICGLKMGKYHHALESLLKGCEIENGCEERTNKKDCEFCRGISQAYSELGQIEEAERWLKKANLSEVAHHSDLGNLHFNAQRWNEALDEYAVSFSLCKNDTDRGVIANSIAIVHLTGKQDWYTAWQYFQPALHLLEDENVSDEVKARLFNTLAQMQAMKGDLDFALQIYETLLVMRKKIYGENHPDVARVYQNIGGVYAEKGKKALALNNWEMAAMMFISVSGKDNVHTKQCVTNICNYLLTNGTEQELEAILTRLGYRG
ncbi:tetratricopeptide repeat protein, partial [Ruminococcaceae bacterium OttesenSCG-928-L11]|nr:tetratricopeptide repeat protein [Ruminococcaceae bacterium OttesenSCG-928-L11]